MLEASKRESFASVSMQMNYFVICDSQEISL